jgi:FMN reductase
MGSPRHALAVEVHLRPLLVELGATVPTPGLAVVESDLGRIDEILAEWAAALRIPEALTTPCPEGRGFRPSRAGVPVSVATAPERASGV